MVQTIESINKEICKLNKQFKEGTKEERAVLLAKDVLAQIKANKYIAKSKTWVNINFKEVYNGSTYTKDVPLQFENKQFNLPEVQESIENCQVCGLGSLMCSIVRANNHATVDDLAATNRHGSSLDTLLNKLTTVFIKTEIIAIEAAFEGGSGSFAVGGNSYTNFSYETFFIGYSGYNSKFHNYFLAAKNFVSDLDAETRLIKIMKNIIKNKGHFKPNDVYYK